MAASSEAADPVRWGRVIALIVLGALLVEAASQAAIQWFAGSPFRSFSYYRWSPYGLVRNNPDHTSPAFNINRNGFREVRNYEKRKGPRTFRVMLMGGSVLYAGLGGPARLDRYGRVSSAHTISQYLTERMRGDAAFADFEVEVINAAVNYNRIVEVSASYLEEYVHWDPDFVIVFGSVNNFGGLRRRGEFARFETELQAPHSWRLEFERIVNDHGIAAFLERIWRTGAENSAALALSTKAAVKLADRLVAMAGAIAKTRDARPERDTESRAEGDAYFRLYATYASAMIAAARTAGHGIAFAWEPLLGDRIKRMSAEEREIFPAVERSSQQVAQIEQARRRMQTYLHTAGIRFVDPTDAFREHGETVFIDYVHYTPEGNRFVANFAFEQLRSELLDKLAVRRAGKAGG